MNFTRIFQRLVTCIVFFLLFQAAAFAAPPILVESPDSARLKLIKESEKYLGVPYRYGGMNTGGMDCSGLLCLVFQNALNASVPRTVASLYSWTEKIDMNDLQLGDLVFFNTTGRISHVGLYAGNGRFIHSASEGSQTGVMYSSLDEPYWKRTYVASGRAISSGSGAAGPAPSLASGNQNNEEKNPASTAKNNDSNLSFSIGAAISWNNYIHEKQVIRGTGFQIGAAYALSVPEKKLSLGLELRPEWDIQLGVFRLPVTLSFGGEMFRVFLGPVLSFGDPVLDVPKGERYFDGGTSWVGEGGVTFAPFTFKTGTGKLAFYAELAWQFYYPKRGQGSDWMANISAASRISTGIRYIFGK